MSISLTLFIVPSLYVLIAPSEETSLSMAVFLEIAAEEISPRHRHAFENPRANHQI